MNDTAQVARLPRDSTCAPTSTAAPLNVADSGEPMSTTVTITTQNFASGLGSFTHIVQMELERYGVTVNAIAPSARTRLTMSVPGAQEREAERCKAAPGEYAAQEDDRKDDREGEQFYYGIHCGCAIQDSNL